MQPEWAPPQIKREWPDGRQHSHASTMVAFTGSGMGSPLPLRATPLWSPSARPLLGGWPPAGDGGSGRPLRVAVSRPVVPTAKAKSGKAGRARRRGGRNGGGRNRVDPVRPRDDSGSSAAASPAAAVAATELPGILPPPKREAVLGDAARGDGDDASPPPSMSAATGGRGVVPKSPTTDDDAMTSASLGASTAAPAGAIPAEGADRPVTASAASAAAAPSGSVGESRIASRVQPQSSNASPPDASNGNAAAGLATAADPGDAAFVKPAARPISRGEASTLPSSPPSTVTAAAANNDDPEKGGEKPHQDILDTLPVPAAELKGVADAPASLTKRQQDQISAGNEPRASDGGSGPLESTHSETTPMSGAPTRTADTASTRPMAATATTSLSTSSTTTPDAPAVNSSTPAVAGDCVGDSASTSEQPAVGTLSKSNGVAKRATSTTVPSTAGVDGTGSAAGVVPASDESSRLAASAATAPVGATSVIGSRTVGSSVADVNVAPSSTPDAPLASSRSTMLTEKGPIAGEGQNALPAKAPATPAASLAADGERLSSQQAADSLGAGDGSAPSPAFPTRAPSEVEGTATAPPKATPASASSTSTSASQGLGAASPPVGDATGASPPAGDATGASPPAGDATGASPPAGDATGASPPAGDATGASPPAGDATGASPPAGDATGASPPAGDATGASPPSDKGAGASPPISTSMDQLSNTDAGGALATTSGTDSEKVALADSLPVIAVKPMFARLMRAVLWPPTVAANVALGLTAAAFGIRLPPPSAIPPRRPRSPTAASTRRGVVLGLGVTATTFVAGAAVGRRTGAFPHTTTRYRDAADIPATAFHVVDGPASDFVLSAFVTDIMAGDMFRVRHTPLRFFGSRANDPRAFYARRALPRSDPASLPRDDDGTMPVVLAGVDCPAVGRYGLMGAALAEEARSAVADIFVTHGGGAPGGSGGRHATPRGGGAAVRLGLAARDEAGRLIATVWVGSVWDPVDVAAELLAAGLAVTTPGGGAGGAFPSEWAARYARLEEDAKARGVGMWRIGAWGETPAKRRARQRAGDARG